jgi:hypothetical protein
MLKLFTTATLTGLLALTISPLTIHAQPRSTQTSTDPTVLRDLYRAQNLAAKRLRKQTGA